MFQRVQQYELMNRGDEWYGPRAYAEPLHDGRWGGWLVFFPLGGGPAIATNRETVQTTFDALVDWAAGITPTYLEGALERAIHIENQVPIAEHLAAEEYEALAEARVLETQAAAARAEAQVLHEERVATEDLIATADETEATIEAVAHERAASQARALAADAADRRREAEGRTSQTDNKSPVKRRSRRKA